uniref:Chitin-binding type-2 domain-containing protein n=1 Tax=Meloidogyne hapla TaxID=6305 RepID=A0A1I8C2R9_MELHA
MKPKKNIAHAYYGEDGRCGWYNVTTQKYEQPKLKYPNAFVPADDGNNEYKMDKGRFCLFQFHQIAMQPLCGDEWYSQIKYCAMVDFYQNHEPYPVKLGDYNESDVVLFMVDGCVLCTSDSYSNDTAVKIQIEHAWKGGSKFTSCKQTQHPAETLTINMTQQNFYDVLVSTQDPSSSLIEDVGNAIKYQAYLNAYSSSFSIAAVLYHRVCKGLIS